MKSTNCQIIDYWQVDFWKINYLPAWLQCKIVISVWQSWRAPPPSIENTLLTSGTFMSSNDLVSHQTHRDGQFYDAKWSKILFNYKRYSRIAKRFIVFQNFVPKNLKFFKILLLVASRWYIFSWLIISWLIVNVGWWLVGC